MYFLEPVEKFQLEGKWTEINFSILNILIQIFFYFLICELFLAGKSFKKKSPGMDLAFDLQSGCFIFR